MFSTLTNALLNYDKQFLEKKAWGYKYNVYGDHYIAVDICFVKKNGFCSWHEHAHQFNAFLILFGKLKITREYMPNSDQHIDIIIGPKEKSRKTMVFPKHKHKFEALEESIFIEIGTVKYSRDDIQRHVIGGIKE